MKQFTCIFIILVLAFSGCQSDPDEGRYSSIAEGRSLNVPAMTGGKIIQLNVDTGNPVIKHQVLGVIDTSEFNIQRSLIMAQFAELSVQSALAGNAVEQANTRYQHIAEKQQRISKLFAENATSRQSIDDVNNLLEQAELSLTQARQGARTLAAKRDQLQAQLNLLQKKITDAVIRAPAPGIISERFYERGEAMPPLAPLVEIIDLQEMEVKIYISELQLPHVRSGQQASIHVDGYAPVISGTVGWISPRAEFTPKSVLTAGNRTSLVYAVKIMVPNADGVIKHGMPVTVELM